MKRVFTVGLVLSLAAAGCVVEVTFDPFGTDFALSGTWTVNGQPASQAACDAAGIAEVRVVLFDEGTPFTYSELTFPCAAGSFQTAQIFQYGNYESSWEALDGKGDILNLTIDREVLRVFSPNTLAALRPQDFVSTGTPVSALDVGLRFGLPAAPDTFDVCTSAGVSTIDYSLAPTGGAPVVTMVGDPCGDLSFSDLQDGTYDLTVDGRLASGVIGWSGVCTNLNVVGGVGSGTCNFDYVQGLTINMTFSAAGGPDATCQQSGITNVVYQLLDGTGTVVQGSMASGPCPADSRLSFTGLTAGSYSLQVVDAEAGAVKFMGICSDLVLNQGEGVVEYNCMYNGA